jgi:hypothetical protein
LIEVITAPSLQSSDRERGPSLKGGMTRIGPNPTFFPTESNFRRWLAANHATAPELLVGFWKKGSGKPSIDWPQARDQAQPSSRT